MRGILRAISRHSLSGLQGALDDRPTTIPCKEAYFWLLSEADVLGKGAAELIHSFFNACMTTVICELHCIGQDSRQSNRLESDLVPTPQSPIQRRR